MKEEWRPVFDGRYSVSNLGRVRRDAAGRGAVTGRILKRRVWGPGYLMVTIYYPQGKPTLWYVHRIVAEAFLGPCPPGMECNHKDGDKENPRLSNLEYVTPSENMQHAVTNGLCAPQGLKGVDHPRAKLTDEKVREIRALVSAGEKHRTVAARFDVSRSLVTQVVNRQIWGHVK